MVLPTFILEKRSLLEMYANFMAHPDMFLSITAGATAEDRIVRFVEYYLTAFHEGRKGAVAKKPYNPVLGETFHCSWEVPRDKVKPLDRSNPGSAWEPSRGPNNTQQDEDSPGSCYRVRFVAEQVSHHPPVSGFYCECRERRMCVNAHVWTKSKFMGMSIGVSMVGEGKAAQFLKKLCSARLAAGVETRAVFTHRAHVGGPLTSSECSGGLAPLHSHSHRLC